MTVEANLRGDGARPLGSLIGGLATDISGLFHKEIELAKAEASEKLGSVLTGVELLVAGAVIGIGAIGVLFAGIVSAIAAFFVAQGMGPTAASALSSLIVFIIAGLIAWAFIARARASLSAANLRLDRTTQSLARDAAAVKEKL